MSWGNNHATRSHSSPSYAKHQILSVYHNCESSSIRLQFYTIRHDSINFRPKISMFIFTSYRIVAKDVVACQNGAKIDVTNRRLFNEFCFRVFARLFFRALGKHTILKNSAKFRSTRKTNAKLQQWQRFYGRRGEWPLTAKQFRSLAARKTVAKESKRTFLVYLFIAWNYSHEIPSIFMTVTSAQRANVNARTT